MVSDVTGCHTLGPGRGLFRPASSHLQCGATHVVLMQYLLLHLIGYLHIKLGLRDEIVHFVATGVFKHFSHLQLFLALNAHCQFSCKQVQM